MKNIITIIFIILFLGSCTKINNDDIIEKENHNLSMNQNVIWKKIDNVINPNIWDKTDQITCIENKEDIKIYTYMYHYIRNRNWDKSDAWFINNAVITENFEIQMQKFQELEQSWIIKIIFLSELEEYQKNNCFPNKNIVILTSDDGWDDNYINLYPIAKKYNIKFHLSIISNNVREKRFDNFITQSELIEISNDDNFEIIWHTYTHIDLRNLNDYYLNRELCESKISLENITNTQLNTIIYPAWKYNSKTIKKSQECWYKYGFTTQNWIITVKDLDNSPLKLKRIRVSRSTTVNALTHYFD